LLLEEKMSKTDYKGIVLAGGTGSRLFPITLGTSKQLLPVYDKPLIYYPISVLMLAGIRDILIITSPEYLNNYKALLGNGQDFGINFEFKIQKRPEGVAQALILGAEFIDDSNVVLVLGDNLFYGQAFSKQLFKVKETNIGATIFGYQVLNPERFGVVELDSDGSILSIEEKPTNPRSNIAVTGLYFYDNDVIRFAKNIKPSARAELEITDLNEIYLKNNNLNVEVLGRGFTWLDTGNCESLMEASNFVQTIEKRQGLKIACLEEIAFSNGWITTNRLKKRAYMLRGCNYGQYLSKLATYK